MYVSPLAAEMISTILPYFGMFVKTMGETNGKLEFIGEKGLCTFLSVAKEKYQKNRHVRKGPRSFPYGSYPLSGAAFLPGGKKA